MPYISITTRKNSKESLTTIFCTITIYLYISFNRKLGHRHPHTVTSKKWCSCVQNCTEHQSLLHTTMTVTKTNVTISVTQPNDVSLDCHLGCHFGWHGNSMAPDHLKMIWESIGTGSMRAKCPWMDSQSENHDLPIQA